MKENAKEGTQSPKVGRKNLHNLFHRKRTESEKVADDKKHNEGPKSPGRVSRNHGNISLWLEGVFHIPLFFRVIFSRFVTPLNAFLETPV